MSIRPENQSLKPACEKLLAGIKEFTDAVGYRLDADWTEEHLKEIDEINQGLIALRARINKVKNETW